MLLALALACTPAAVFPEVSGLRQVVPSDGIPDEIVAQEANNNLDVAWHEGRLFLAWRTAPSHFASEHTVMVVASSEDELSWRYEGQFALGTDVREPQLVSWQGELLLYFAVLGTDPLDFEPQGARLARYRGPGDWSEPEPVFAQTFIPWRIKEIDGRLHTVGYEGGENVYEPDGEPIRVHWLASDDGVTWGPAEGGDSLVLEGGGSETDLLIRPDGSLVAVVRNEAGDEGGFGSKICSAEAGALTDWSCVHDPRKYDSPLLLEAGGEVWLVGRRNLTDTGHFDLGRDDLSRADQYLNYQFAYWQARKRCAIWHVDAESLVVTHALDLPSRGDTCFPEAVPAAGGEGFLLYNYSSPVDGPDQSWMEAQTGLTHVYRMRLDFVRQDAP